MTTLNLQVGASSDDAWQRDDTGAMNLTGGQVALLVGTRWGGFRFTSVSGMSGATVDTAVFNAHHPDDTDDFPDETVYVEEVEAPATFTTDVSNITDRPLTTATVAWDDGGVGQGVGWSEDQATPCPDIKALIQELLDAPNNFDPSTLVVILDHMSSIDHDINSYDTDTALAAKLVINYTPAAGPSLPRIERHYPRGANRGVLRGTV